MPSFRRPRRKSEAIFASSSTIRTRMTARATVARVHETTMKAPSYADGVRWHRCLRCDAWLPLAPPARPTRGHPPDRAHIELPLRGRPLRDKIVLRAIAIDRAIHFVVLGLLAGAIFILAAHRDQLRAV